MGYTKELCRRSRALPRFIQNRKREGIRSIHPRSALVLTSPDGNVLSDGNNRRSQQRGGFLIREILPNETIAVLNEVFRKS